MNLINCPLTTSTWYAGVNEENRRQYMGTRTHPIGVLWHDTGAGNPSIKRYVQPADNDPNKAELLNIIGKNKYNNDWNHAVRNGGVNAFIGKLADGSVGTVLTGDFELHPWGCGGGTRGSGNGYIKDADNNAVWIPEYWFQFEICDDGYKDKEYFEACFEEACQLTAYICHEFEIDPGTEDAPAYVTDDPKVKYFTKDYFMSRPGQEVKIPTIMCHGMSTDLKLGCDHTDIYPWFKKMGYTKAQAMAKIRKRVAEILAQYEVPPAAEVDFTVGDLVRLRPNITQWASGKQFQNGY